MSNKKCVTIDSWLTRGVGGNSTPSQPERTSVRLNDCTKRIITTTPASKRTTVVVDLTSSPSPTRSRSPIDCGAASGESDCIDRRPETRHKRKALAGKDDGQDEVVKFDSSDAESSSSGDDREPAQVEDGIIGMRIRTPGRKST